MVFLTDVAQSNCGDAECPNTTISFQFLGTVVKYLWLFSAKYWED
jgi:hypothetical protein